MQQRFVKFSLTHMIARSNGQLLLDVQFFNTRRMLCVMLCGVIAIPGDRYAKVKKLFGIDPMVLN